MLVALVCLSKMPLTAADWTEGLVSVVVPGGVRRAGRVPRQ